MNILEIFTEDVSDQVKFRKYCEFYRDLDPGNIIFNWDKTNAVLEDSVQEFYPEFIVLRDFFRFPKFFKDVLVYLLTWNVLRKFTYSFYHLTYIILQRKNTEYLGMILKCLSGNNS